MGGTSLGAPAWAALIAVANQGRVAEGGTTLDGSTQTLPALYSLPAADFHDITGGGNGTESAGPGYDQVTGLGSPVANRLVPDLAFYGMADHLVVTAQPPASATAGSGLGLSVAVESPDGSLVTGATGTITVSLGQHPGGASLGGTLTATINQGIATFSGLTIDQAGTGYTLTLSGSGLGSATSSSFNIVPAGAARLALATQPPTSLAAGAGFGLSVDVEDAYGNLDGGYSGNVSLALKGGPAGASLGGTLTTVVVNGVASFSGLTIDEVGSGYSIAASAAGPSGVTTQAMVVSPASASRLVIGSAPSSSQTAGSAFGITVSVEDAYGNLVSGYGSAVTVGLTGGPSGAALGGTPSETASGGVATFSGLTIDRAGTGYAIQVNAPGLPTAATTTFAITPAAASTLAVTAAPGSSVVAGSGFGLTVGVQDAYGNPVAVSAGAVTLSLLDGPAGSSLAGSLQADLGGGLAAFSGLTIDRAATGYEIQASSPGLASVDTTAFAVTPAAASGLVIVTEPAASQAAGIGFGLTLDVEDAYGNLVTGYGSEVTLGLTGGPSGAALGGTLDATAKGGVANFTGLTVDQAGTGYQIQAAASGLATTVNTTSFTVTPAAASGLVIIAEPAAGQTAGVGFGLTLDVEDAYGNLATGYGGEVTLGLMGGPSGAVLGGTLGVLASGGVATFSGLTINQAGAGFAIEASGGGFSPVTTTTLSVSPAAQSQLVLTVPPPSSTTAGNSFGLTVVIEDAYGNLATGYDGPVDLALTGGPPGASLGGPNAVDAVGGVASFTGLGLTRAGSGYAITASGSGLGVVSTNPIDVSPAAPTQLRITGEPPASTTAGAPFGLTVSVEDAYGNLVSGYQGNVAVNLSGGPAGANLGGGTAVEAVHGVASYSSLTIGKAGTGFTVDATGPGLSGTSSSAFGVVPATPAGLIVTTQPPASVTAGAGFGLGVSVEDAYGNLVTGYSGSLSVSMTGGPAGGGISGPTSVAVVRGVGTFSGLTLDKAAAGDSLKIAASGLSAVSTAAVQVVPATPSQLVIADQPADVVVAGQPFGFRVEAEDAYGNVVTTFNGPVTAALLRDPAGGSLAGSVTTTAANGSAEFSGLALDRAGAGYALQATSGSLATVTTAPIVVSAAPASRLVVISEPDGSIVRRRPFTLAVEAQDAFGNLATGFNGAVLAALSANPNRNRLAGDLATQATGGEAVIAGALMRKTGRSYAITITSSGLTPAATSAFNVARQLPGGPATARRAVRIHVRDHQVPSLHGRRPGR